MTKIELKDLRTGRPVEGRVCPFCELAVQGDDASLQEHVDLVCPLRPNRTIKLADTTGLLRSVASAMIARHGSYTFTDTTTGEKVKVVK